MFQLNRNLFRVLALCLVPAIISTNVLAESDVTEMSLLVQSNDVSFKFPNSVDRTKISTIEVTWWQSFSDVAELRLNIAYVELSQNVNSTVSAYNTTGYEVGIGFRGNVFESEIINIGIGATFDYLSSQGETTLNNEATEVTWLKYSGGVNFVFLPSNSISILTGASYTTIDGEHELTDTAGSLVTFTEDESEGYYAGLSFKSGQRGKITMSWHGGHREGVYLTFSSRF